MSYIPAPQADYLEEISKGREKLFQAASYLSKEDADLLEEVCAFAEKAHHDQRRKSGEPYITHPIAVAIQVADWGEDLNTLRSALLHDVVEDTPITIAQIREKFGDGVAEVVDGLSKLEKIAGKDRTEAKAESFRKLLLAAMRDLRVLVVKLADRLHNMRTLEVMRKEKQQRIARETLEIYAELANRVGMHGVYCELQDLSFRYLNPHRYEVIKRAFSVWRKENEALLAEQVRKFITHLEACNILADVKGKEKNIYGIFKKMRCNQFRFFQVSDMYGFVVLVNTVDDCYRALGAMHSLYKPKPGSFRDNIALPKKNGFQTLQTTLMSSLGLPLEVQIRTFGMDRWDQKWSSYENVADPPVQVDKQTQSWFEKIQDVQQGSENAVEFYEEVKKELFQDELYAFAPEGNFVGLPTGATVVDFAYAMDLSLGHQTVGARVNGLSTPLHRPLKSGDVVEILRDKDSNPDAAWLNFVVTAKARSAIRSRLRQQEKTRLTQSGQEKVASGLKSLLSISDNLSEDLKERYAYLLRKQKRSFEDILYRVGLGKLQAAVVVIEIANLADKTILNISGQKPLEVSAEKTAYILAECCKPRVGNAIIAQLSDRGAIVIHRDNCVILQKQSEAITWPAQWKHTEVKAS